MNTALGKLYVAAAFVLSIVLLGNAITPRQWAGYALIGLAVWVISRREKAEKASLSANGKGR